MGRIKGFFCSCLDDGADCSNNEPSFDRNLDVSHLATPHSTTTIDRSLTPTARRNTAEDKYSSNYDNPQQLRPQQSQNDHTSKSEPNGQHIIEASAAPPSARPSPNPNQEAASPPQPSSSSPFAPSPVDNLYEPTQTESHHQAPASPELHRQSNSQHAATINAPQAQASPPPPPPPLVQPRNAPSTSNETTAKLSYDIISVREPLAKILAERQQLLQSQQQRDRQILGDHDYIEVYGERGSSCFYEEIAGSVTSSVTYDQIGAASNHNYQVLVNAYSVASRQPSGNQADELDDNHGPHDGPSDSNNNKREENAYDVTSHRADQADGGPPFSGSPIKEPGTDICLYECNGPSSSNNGRLTQSIPVYSVINKATRRGSSIMRKTFDSTTPPEPPPKNLFISQHQQASTSTTNEPLTSTFQYNSNALRTRSPVPQVPSTSYYAEVKREPLSSNNSPGNKHRNSRLPQPPPRYSKQTAFNHTADRPLPSPNNPDGVSKISNNESNDHLTSNQKSMNGYEDDIESLNNGYELLRSNLDDDQIDVGYEKIREPNRYSGGSIPSQFYSRQLLDNGGYESVQPIYSSPSNCYEVLTPATASEIAAAAAAKLNVIEKSFKKD